MKIVAPRSRLSRWELGRCTSANDTDYIYVPLPKCASRYTVQVLNYMCGWMENGNFILNKELQEKKKIIALRDPLSRWLSGIVHHFHLQELQMLDENMHYIFNQITLDPHSELQVKYLEGLDTDQCVFLMLDDTYTNNLKHFIVNVLNKNYTFWNKQREGDAHASVKYPGMIWHNTTEERPHKKQHMIGLKKFMESHPEYEMRIKAYLEPDYELIKNIEFYKGNKNG